MPVMKLQESTEARSSAPSTTKKKTLIPDDTIVLVKVMDVNEVTKPFNDDDGNPVVRIEFEFKVIEEGEYNDRHVWQEVYTEFDNSSRCRLRLWVQEMLAVDSLPNDYVLDTDDLLGKKVQVVIGIREWTNKNGTPGRKNTVKYLSRAVTPVPFTAPVPQPRLAVVSEEDPF